MLSIVCIALAAFGVAVLARLSDRSWVSPAPFFALMWAGYLLSLLLFSKLIDGLVPGMLWILLSVSAVCAGSMAARPFLTPPVQRDPVPDDAALWVLRWICVVALVTGVINMMALVAARGFSPSGLLQFAIIAQVSAANRAQIYAGDADTSILQRLVWIGLFIASAYGAILFRIAARGWDRVLGFMPMFIASALYSLFGSRMGVLYGGSLWIGTYLATHIVLSDPIRGVGIRFLVRLGLGSIVLIVGLSTLSQVLRYSAGTRALDWQRMLADPFAFVAAFGIWFNHDGMKFTDLYYGARLFRRFSEILGVVSEIQPAISVGFTDSNIYTVYRDLIEDFNPVGSTVFLFLMGLFGRLTFAAALSGRTRALPWLTLLYAFALTSFSSGLLSYTVPTAALLLFIGSFRFLPSIVRERSGGSLPASGQ
ncbi:MAG: hypothetical protein JWM95_3342 [Gemmatimonadetes bacterium]|nr:hypothetical protein [Gemmatimonadota bacterium]